MAKHVNAQRLFEFLADRCQYKCLLFECDSECEDMADCEDLIYVIIEEHENNNIQNRTLIHSWSINSWESVHYLGEVS